MNYVQETYLSLDIRKDVKKAIIKFKKWYK